MKIAILGFARDGNEAFTYWNKSENTITICDKNKDIEVPKEAKSQLGKDYLKNLDKFDLIVRSAGLPPHLITEANPNHHKILDKVTTITNEFMNVCPSKNIIGVTGTKGKGTTCTLITKMLEAAGHTVHLGGNIGIPALELLNPPAGGDIKPDDWVVLEQSSFQLIDQKYSPHIAVCLMVIPEHLDWHKTVEEYYGAKKNLFAHQVPGDIAIYNEESDNSIEIAEVSPGRKTPYMSAPGAEVVDDDVVINGQPICDVGEIKLLGRHNWQNVCAAVTAVWQITQDVDAIKKVITTFSGLEHRLEMVGEVNSVKYYDDSFGTTPETAIVAIEAFTQPKVLILGGSDKKAKFDELAYTIKNDDVRQVITIGDTSPKIRLALQKVGYTDVVAGGDNMKDIVDKAHEAANPGDVVLLSPACASFGMFKDYKDRGNQFKQAVQALH